MKVIENNRCQLNITQPKKEFECISCLKYTHGKQYEWRLRMKSGKFHQGSFWTWQCKECALETIGEWEEQLAHMKGMINGFGV